MNDEMDEFDRINGRPSAAAYYSGGERGFRVLW
jgi:hypothetical protein